MARRGLGKGLDAIIPSSPVEEAVPATRDSDQRGEANGSDDPRSGLYVVPIESIRPNPQQPRKVFEQESLEDLARSIAEIGVLQPPLVRRHGDGYTLIAGERRWRAAQAAGLAEIPVLVREADDQGSLETALVENLHREDLNPLEEAAAYSQLIADFSLTQDQVADRVGKSRPAVANALRLLSLSSDLQLLVASGALRAGHARALLGTVDEGFRQALAEKIVGLGLSVRDVEEAVRRHAEGVAEPPAPTEPGSTKAAGLLELESLLADLLATRVTVSMGRRRGRIQIEFADLDDLERISMALLPG